MAKEIKMLGQDVDKSDGDDLLNQFEAQLYEEEIRPMFNASKSAGKIKDDTKVLTRSYAIKKVMQAFRAGYRLARHTFQ